MLNRIAVVITSLVLGPAAALAENVVLESPARQVKLLELYTSEGCSSCPPADRWLSRLRDDPRLWQQVVPVAFHVDYWDYIGWEDRFASAEYSRRQREYTRQGHVRTVYTPGLILGGEEWRSWFRKPVLELDEGEEVGTLSLELADRQVAAVFAPETAGEKRLEFHVALLGFGLETDVRAGENSGRKLVHDFAVLGYQRVPTRFESGTHRADFALPEPDIQAERRAIALWVSRADDPRPIQAVGGWLN